MDYYHGLGMVLLAPDERTHVPPLRGVEFTEEQIVEMCNQIRRAVEIEGKSWKEAYAAMVLPEAMRTRPAGPISPAELYKLGLEKYKAQLAKVVQAAEIFNRAPLIRAAEYSGHVTEYSIRAQPQKTNVRCCALTHRLRPTPVRWRRCARTRGNDGCCAVSVCRPTPHS